MTLVPRRKPREVKYIPNQVPRSQSEFINRFARALSAFLTADGVPIPVDMVVDWFTNSDDDLQDYVASNLAPPYLWMQAIQVIDAATLLAENPEEGCDHKDNPWRKVQVAGPGLVADLLADRADVERRVQDLYWDRVVPRAPFLAILKGEKYSFAHGDGGETLPTVPESQRSRVILVNAEMEGNQVYLTFEHYDDMSQANYKFPVGMLNLETNGRVKPLIDYLESNCAETKNRRDELIAKINALQGELDSL